MNNITVTSKAIGKTAIEYDSLEKPTIKLSDNSRITINSFL